MTGAFLTCMSLIPCTFAQCGPCLTFTLDEPLCMPCSAQEEVSQIEREIVFKQEDNALLEQFMNNDTVTVGDKTYSAR